MKNLIVKSILVAYLISSQLCFANNYTAPPQPGMPGKRPSSIVTPMSQMKMSPPESGTNQSVANQQMQNTVNTISKAKIPNSSNLATQKQTNQKYTKPSLQKNESLQNVINHLSDADRKIVLSIQREISTWPKTLVSELALYREYIESMRKEAEGRFKSLSPQARKALVIENQMKSQLSKGALQALENAKVK